MDIGRADSAMRMEPATLSDDGRADRPRKAIRVRFALANTVDSFFVSARARLLFVRFAKRDLPNVQKCAIVHNRSGTGIVRIFFKEATSLFCIRALV